MNIAEGVIAALLSPMHEDESIHCEQMRRLAARQIAAGVHGLFVAGTNGEAYALSPQEKLRLAESVLREAEGKVPVYFGSGLCGTRETIELSKEAQRLGVDALSIVCPYFAPVSQEGLYAHFSEIAAAVSLPIILYNIPARTGVNLAPATVARLAQIQRKFRADFAISGIRAGGLPRAQRQRLAAAVDADGGRQRRHLRRRQPVSPDDGGHLRGLESGRPDARPAGAGAHPPDSHPVPLRFFRPRDQAGGQFVGPVRRAEPPPLRYDWRRRENRHFRDAQYAI